jgi:hypothetical protein
MAGAGAGIRLGIGAAGRLLARLGIRQWREARSLRHELAGLRRAVEALVAVQAFQAGIPNPLEQAPPVADGREPSADEVDAVDVPTGAYAEADARRAVYDRAAAHPSAFDADFIGMTGPAADQFEEALIAGRVNAGSLRRGLGLGLRREDR